MKKNMHLDTNILIGVFSEEKELRAKLKRFFHEGYSFSVSALVWHEFVSGPVKAIQKQHALSLIEERILPMDKDIAELASELYNSSGRKKSSRPDCIVAATAINYQAEMLTLNASDFKAFSKQGLELVDLK